jgi:transcriptional regulator with XRE-family HTH domain
MYALPYYAGRMDDLDKLIARIREPILSGKMTKAELARRANLRKSTLTGFDRPGWDPRAKTIKALLRAVSRRPLGNAANQRSVAA